jgi:hypothetical protein
MFSSLSQKLSFVTIVFISLMKFMNCDCGPPGIPSNGSILTEYSPSYPENFKIEYKCNGKQDQLAYNSTRICRKGKWTGRVPKCGKS